MMDPENLFFATDFAPATREEWRKLVDAVLKGAPFERLVSTTYDGLPIAPLATRRPDARPVPAQATAASWQVIARIEHPDPAAAREIAVRELDNGADGLALVFAGSPGAHGFGLPATVEAVTRALDGVILDAGIALDIDLPPFARVLPQQIAQAIARSFAPSAVNVHFGYDPLTAIAMTGTMPLPWDKTAPLMAVLVNELADAGFKGPFAVGDGRLVHNAGGSEAQELSLALGSALAYLRALEASGMTLEAARAAIYFRLAADADQFLTVAKFRALRKLWARVETACGLAPKPALVAAETAWRMMTQRDAHTNILRATIAMFAAAVGGADAIAALPFTAARGLPDRFARRIARNSELILREEVHLDKVGDPAAGSGAVEDLTDELCQAAWHLFQEVERAGGVAAALASGLIQGKIAAVREQREAAVACRRDALTGATTFPNLHEIEAAVDAPFPPRASGGKEQFASLAPIRLAEPFEKLRDASDRILAATGARPKIFLANLGKLVEFTPRATFAKNFFEAGGIETVSSDKGDLPSLPTAFKDFGAKLACLCSSDAVYEKEAAAAAAALKAAGTSHLYLAGRPGRDEADLRAAGIDSFIFEGCDALATLNGAYDTLVEPI